MECDSQPTGTVGQLRSISTHALTWSATGYFHLCDGYHSISTHALTWSATQFDSCSHFFTSNFNSRTHVECDLLRLSFREVCRKQFQLTHSRGVRLILKCLPHLKMIFQLTHSRGVRHTQPCKQNLSRQFQLTHSRGVRHSNLLLTLQKE